MIAQSKAAAAMISQRAAPVLRYRNSAQAPAVAAAIPSVSAMTTRLDCKSCPVVATMRAATSGTDGHATPVSVRLRGGSISFASAKVRSGAAAAAARLTACPAAGTGPTTLDAAATRGGYPGGQKNDGSACR